MLHLQTHSVHVDVQKRQMRQGTATERLTAYTSLGQGATTWWPNRNIHVHTHITSACELCFIFKKTLYEMMVNILQTHNYSDNTMLSKKWPVGGGKDYKDTDLALRPHTRWMKGVGLNRLLSLDSCCLGGNTCNKTQCPFSWNKKKCNKWITYQDQCYLREYTQFKLYTSFTASLRNHLYI